jgi:hypothetical protein
LGQNTYIGLAAKPGQSAKDNKPGTNGYFTAALLRNIARPVDIDTIFRDVGREVAKVTGNTQETWSSHNLRGSVILASANSVSPQPRGSNAVQMATAGRQERNPDSCEARSAEMPEPMRRDMVSQCLTASMLRIQDALGEHKERTLREIASLTRIAELSGHSVADLLILFFSIWKHPWFSLGGTVLISMVIGAGFYRRELSPGPLFAYARFIHTEQRIEVEEVRARYSEISVKFQSAPKKELLEKCSPFENAFSTKAASDSFSICRDSYDYWLGRPILVPS